MFGWVLSRSTHLYLNGMQFIWLTICPQNIETIITAAQLTKPTNPLVERFKYKVISSSLLSPNLPTPHAYGQIYAQHHSIPGNLPHSRTPSDLSQAYNLPGTPGPCPSDSVAGEAQACKTRFGLLPCLVVIFAILLSAGLTRTAVLTLWTGLAGIYYLRVRSHATRPLDLIPVRLSLPLWRSISDAGHTAIVPGNS